MRWGEKEPADGTWRVIERFAWSPITLTDQTRLWLERYYEVERYWGAIHRWLHFGRFGDLDRAWACVAEESERRVRFEVMTQRIQEAIARDDEEDSS